MLDLLLVILIVVLIGAVIWFALKVEQFKKRFSGIFDVEAEISRLEADLKRDKERYENSVSKHQSLIYEMSQKYLANKRVYDNLCHQVSLLEETLEDVSFGIYRPHYKFDDPDGYKRELDKIYEQKKALIKAGSAVTCPNKWTVNNSEREGAKMIKQESKLMLRAFNGETDAAIAKVSWNNATKMEERITKCFGAVNELGSVMQIRINTGYLNLAIAELRLTHELETKKQDAKEEQRQIKEQMREEELAQKEFERAKKAAEAEEVRYQKALEAARHELEIANAAEKEAVAEKIEKLEGRLAEAQSKLDRAVSMAQLTKSGHVYVISNIGSFGEDVFKIGMTRRLDPTERVYELGSASVPFPYDIHAMIYTTDAPGLENAFHRMFYERRVNMVNTRKEFFRVSLDELETFALTHNADIQFTKLAEAREFRETKNMLEKLLTKSAEEVMPESLKVKFPSSLMVEN